MAERERYRDVLERVPEGTSPIAAVLGVNEINEIATKRNNP